MTIQELRRFEKLKNNVNKAELDVNFLTNCRTFDVTPKFLLKKWANINERDAKLIRKKLLKSSLFKRQKEANKLDAELNILTDKLKTAMSPLDFYILLRTVNWNVKKHEKKIIQTHEKKLRNLTNNNTLPYDPNETITNFSTYALNDEDCVLLKNGLSYSIVPNALNNTEIYVTFD